MHARTIERTAITIVQVMPRAMNPAFSNIHPASNPAAAKSATSDPEDDGPDRHQLVSERDAGRAELERLASAASQLRAAGGGDAGSPPPSEPVTAGAPASVGAR